MVYIDDVIIYSKSFEEHLAHVEQVFIILKDANMKVGPEKCTLF